MPKSPELPQLIAQTFRSEPSPDRRQSQQFDVYIHEYDPPKEIVFSENAYLLSPREKEVVVYEYEGKTSKQMAASMGISEFTSKKFRENIRDKIEIHYESLDIKPPHSGNYRNSIWVINSLLQLGELVLRDPELDQTKA